MSIPKVNSPEPKQSCPACAQATYEYIFSKDNIPLFRCQRCKTISADREKFNPQSLYDESYFLGARNGFGYPNYEEDKIPMIKTFQKFLGSMLALREGKKGSLFDIGAATGFFMNLAREAGWEVSGCEISDYAAKISHEKNLIVHNSTLRDLKLPSESFEAVTLWDVLEHFDEPDLEIREIYRVLKPGGVFALSTPDSGSLYAKALGHRWHHIGPPEHLYYFNRKSLRLILERNNFLVSEMSSISKGLTLKYIISCLSSSYFPRAQRSMLKIMGLVPWISNLGIRLNLHDTVFVLATKN